MTYRKTEKERHFADRREGGTGWGGRGAEFYNRKKAGHL
jgi:hypothetical protein